MYQRLHTEKKARVQQIQLLTEQNSKLKADMARFSLSITLLFHFPILLFTLFLFPLYRANDMQMSFQRQIQSLLDNTNKLVEESNALKKEVENKNYKIHEKTQPAIQGEIIVCPHRTYCDGLNTECDKVRAFKLYNLSYLE